MDEDRAGLRRERKDVRRNLQRVLEAAHALFAERGSEVTMEEVARRAGVGVGTIYRRFPSKEHLFAAVSQTACADTRHTLTRAAEAARDPVGKLRALVAVHYRLTMQQAALLELRALPPGMEQAACGLHGEQQRLYAALHHLLIHIIGEGQRQGLMRAGDPALLAALCLELLSPRVFQHVQRIGGGDPEAVADHVLQFMLRGLSARG